MKKSPLSRLFSSPPRVMAFGFLTVILVGAFLLMLPIATVDGEGTSFVDALFTATSATCVTGLAVVDTFLHFSLFGRIVILILIQIGGLGFMTFITFFSLLMHGKLGLSERRMLLESGGGTDFSGMLPLLRRIVLGSFAVEAVGALLLAVRFIPRFGIGEGIWFSVFHSVSAFCNAGFDMMSRADEISLYGYQNDPYVLIVVALLIVFGGIGFLVWRDVTKNKFKFAKYSLHSKMVLCTTAALILLGALTLLGTEWNESMRGMSFGDRITNSFFQSITTRTAGFASIDQASLSDGGVFISLLLMFIGGSPGSTAGGIKTTVFLIFLLDAWSTVRGNRDVVVHKRRIPSETVKQGSAIVAAYVMALFIGVLLLTIVEPQLSLVELLFEAISAIATVGLSMGITPILGVPAKIILTLLMYMGRIGAFSLLLALARKRAVSPLERPDEKILL